jgi:hypothetical protein
MFLLLSQNCGTEIMLYLTASAVSNIKVFYFYDMEYTSFPNAFFAVLHASKH